MAISVQVEGVAQFERALALAQGELRAELLATDDALAASILARAQGLAASLGGVAAHAAPEGLSVAGGGASVALQLNGESVPEILGAEFGGRGRPTTQQFKPWKGNGDTAGYFLFPGIRQASSEGEIEHLYGALVDRILAG